MKKYHIISLLLFIGLVSTASNFRKVPDNPIYNNGFEVYSGFEVLFTETEYKCYKFKAISSYKKHECAICLELYFSQEFEDADNERYSLYSNTECEKSKTRHHDNLNLNDGNIYWDREPDCGPPSNIK